MQIEGVCRSAATLTPERMPVLGLTQPHGKTRPPTRQIYMYWSFVPYPYLSQRVVISYRSSGFYGGATFVLVLAVSHGWARPELRIPRN